MIFVITEGLDNVFLQTYPSYEDYITQLNEEIEDMKPECLPSFKKPEEFQTLGESLGTIVIRGKVIIPEAVKVVKQYG